MTAPRRAAGPKQPQAGLRAPGTPAEALAAIKAAAKRPASKYRAVLTEQDGIKFSSKREAARWKALQLAEQAGEIRDLSRQVSYELHADGGNLVGRYVADHVYRERQGDEWVLVIEDVKGMPTPLYDWKRRHIFAEYGIEIREVR